MNMKWSSCEVERVRLVGEKHIYFGNNYHELHLLTTRYGIEWSHSYLICVEMQKVPSNLLPWSDFPLWALPPCGVQKGHFFVFVGLNLRGHF